MPADLDVDPLDVHPTFQSDIFSLGMLLLQVCGLYKCILSVTTENTVFKLFHGSDGKSLKGLPYNHIRVSSEIGMVKRIHDGVRPRRKRYNHIDDKHWNLLCLCWAGDPSKRPAIGDVRQALWSVQLVARVVFYLLALFAVDWISQKKHGPVSTSYCNISFLAVTQCICYRIIPKS